MRKWSGYLNTQKYSECQLVTAINAWYHLTGRSIAQDTEEYEALVDRCCARHGTALGMQKIHQQFGLRILAEHESLWEFRKGSRTLPLPIEACLWHKRTGFHSVLIVDQCLKTDCLRITNFRQVTSGEGWMFSEDLYQYEHRAPAMAKYRLFGVK